jgi:hypothetical protein
VQRWDSRTYADLFDDINTEEVIEALARSHATTGEPREALAWARKIGCADRVPAAGGDEIRWEVMRRLHALIGLAEGILDRLANNLDEPQR